MEKSPPQERESRPERPKLEQGPEARARREAAHGIRQADMVFATIDRYLASGEPFRNWKKSAAHLASYFMLRINWLHPYVDGNGRTSRAIAYIVLSLRLQTRLPGKNTIVDQIVDSKGRALEAAGRLLARQFALIHAQATGAKP